MTTKVLHLRRAGLIVGFLSTVLITACPPPVYLSIIQPATVDDLAFRTATRPQGNRPARLHFLLVRPCKEAHTDVREQTVLWGIESSDGSRRLAVIRYGVVSDGFIETEPPARLQPNSCYWFVHPGPQGVYVRFDAEGHGTEVTWEEAMNMEGLVPPTSTGSAP